MSLSAKGYKNKVLKNADITWSFTMSANIFSTLQEKLACVLAFSLQSTPEAYLALLLSCMHRIIQTDQFLHLQ